jgi:hypothetical protein
MRDINDVDMTVHEALLMNLASMVLPNIPTVLLRRNHLFDPWC